MESLVRQQLGQALGGRRGMVEAAVPTLAFTALWLTTRNLTLALAPSVAVGAGRARGAAGAAVDGASSCVNALVGIGIGWLFVHLAASRGGSADDQALAYFLPGTDLQHRLRRGASG